MQFVEMSIGDKFSCEYEHHIAGKYLQSNTNRFDFPINLPNGDPCNSKFLMAIAAFATLPSAPAPDYIIDPKVFDPAGDTLNLFFYDMVSFGSGDLPIDNLRSMNHDLAIASSCCGRIIASIGKFFC